MNVTEFFVRKWEAEQPAFLKVIRALPGDQLDYRPHPRSSSAGGIAWQLAEEQRVLADLLQSGAMEWEERKRPETIEEIAAAYEKATNDLRPHLAKLDEAKAAEKGDFRMGGTSVWSDTISNMLWGMLLDMIHHRGQLSAYIRPMGGKVPAIYGPSADEQ